MTFCRVQTIISLLLLSCCLLGQNRELVIKGEVLDANLNEAIPNVHVILDGGLNGTVTDSHGLFEITVSSQEYVKLVFYHTSFELDTVIVDFTTKMPILVKLKDKQYLQEEVTIKAYKESLVKGNIPGKILLKQKDVLITPSLLGEPDLVRTLQLLPGIQSVNEGNSGIYVRGGSPGQNFILFDGIELMNPSHLMGIYSVFNPFLVDNVSFYKGNAPIRYASRLASSIIVNSTENKLGDFNWSVNIGNITSNISYLAKSKNNKWFTSFGFRRSYIEGIQSIADLILQDDQNYFTNNKFNFYDFNGKVKYSSNCNNFVLSWYKGGDYFKYNRNENNISLNNTWGNEGVSLQWRKLITTNFSMNTSVSYSGYDSDLALSIVSQDLSFNTNYQHYQLRSDYLLLQDKSTIRFGGIVQHRTITPQNLDISLNSDEDKLSTKYTHRIFELYASNEFNIFPRLQMYLGGSVQLYQLSEKTMSGFSDEANLDTERDSDRILGKGLVTFNYQLNNDASIKASGNYTTQNIHLTSIASIPLPSDVWMPATQKVPEEVSSQFTLGYFKAFSSLNLEFGIEGYTRFLQNQLVLNLNVKGENVADFEDSFFKGDSKAYGAEFFIKRNSEKLNANLSYTLGWVKQRFDQLNNGKWHDAKYDRRHDINLLCSYKLNEKIELGSVFILATGNKATLPVGRYWMMGNIANDYDGINNFRMPLYHRLDLSVNYHVKSNLFKESVINFSIINVLNRSNPYFIFYDVSEGEENYQLDIKAQQVSLFPILPSLSWKVKF
ncbi:TonB-dependent receptor [Plebeiibacterium sediminum]|uniref:TonB-dependent receptor n=1 Tax=Plebeiibacterium sediminum TaxID=2992112 RepID=A0AAE3M590_9BACT|nr:carboxypeptidase-like regulatory domain-containing protein [Plebeiobacterium sediminum]MCW3787070.1 TonB-dependent receptor [Plebeiobacterium sediminum]